MICLQKVAGSNILEHVWAWKAPEKPEMIGSRQDFVDLNEQVFTLS